MGRRFTYDQSDRHVGSTRGVVSDRVTRDSEGRVMSRLEGSVTTRYGFGGPGDSPGLVANGGGVVQERVLALSGGVTLMKRVVGGDVWSYANLHGDTAAVASPAGVKQGATLRYQVDGRLITSPVDVLTGGHEYGWLGQHQRATASGLGGYVEMGACVYVPTLVRFLGVDPVEGGNANDYTYPNDPVNGMDLDGRCQVNLGLFKLGKKDGSCKKIAANVARTVVLTASVVGIIASSPILVWGAAGVVIVGSIVAVGVDPDCQNQLTTQCKLDLVGAAFGVATPVVVSVAASKALKPAAVNFVLSGLGFLATTEPDKPRARPARKEDF